MVYQPRWTYGSSPEDVRDEVVTRISALNERTVHLALTPLQPGRVYHLRLAESLQSADREALAYRDFYYTANRVPAG
jgi:hypothetical protein